MVVNPLVVDPLVDRSVDPLDPSVDPPLHVPELGSSSGAGCLMLYTAVVAEVVVVVEFVVVVPLVAVKGEVGAEGKAVLMALWLPSSTTSSPTKSDCSTRGSTRAPVGSSRTSC
jgi:hypothetical protein